MRIETCIVSGSNETDVNECDPQSVVRWESMCSRVGIDGLSAYELAVNAGFEGSLEEWLQSLSQPAEDAAQTAQTAAEHAETASDAATNAAEVARTAAQTATTAAEAADQKIAEIDDILGNKANKALPAKEGNLAALNGEGNLLDSGIDPATVSRVDSKGILLPVQFDPLSRYLQGVCTSKGYYMGTSESLIAGGDRTTELLFTTGYDIDTPQCVFSMRGGPSFVVRVTGGTLYIVYGVASHTLSIRSNTSYHVVISKGYIQVNGARTMIAETERTPSTSMFLGRNYDDANQQPFQGILHRLRIFNYILSPEESTIMWNGGLPAEFMLWQGGIVSSGQTVVENQRCVAEYLAGGLLPTLWRDTLGNGVDLTATGTPEYSYQSSQDLRTPTLDTGLFTTDIAAGTASKQISVPAGYVVERIAVMNANSSSITALKASLGDTALFQDKTVAVGQTLVVDVPEGKYSVTGATITVNATGNSTNKGIRIIVFTKWMGSL